MKNLKLDFPIFRNRPDLVYLDSAATTQKPSCVIDALRNYYETSCANINRGSYSLSFEATAKWNEARSLIKSFLGIGEDGELIFTKNATEALNLVAYSLSTELSPGDLIAVSILEHHSNFVPWQQISKRFGFKILIIPTDDEGNINETLYKEILKKEPKIVALTHCSHVLGNIVPIEKFGRLAKVAGAKVVVDGTQMVANSPVNLSKLPIDFYAFSGHKMLGPNGIGCLFGKLSELEKLQPFIFGGDMVFDVSEDETIFTKPPRKFEAGTQPIADAIGLATAIDYLSSVGMDKVENYKTKLINYLIESLKEIPKINIYGPKSARAGIASFSVTGVHSHDVSQILSSSGICVRSGHHCAQPLMRRMNIESLTRASVHIYNTHSDIDVLCKGLRNVLKIFG